MIRYYVRYMWVYVHVQQCEQLKCYRWRLQANPLEHLLVHFDSITLESEHVVREDDDFIVTPLVESD